MLLGRKRAHRHPVNIVDGDAYHIIMRPKLLFDA